MPITEEQLEVLRRIYHLDKDDECDAEGYGLQHGGDFDRWFLESYLPYYGEDDMKAVEIRNPIQVNWTKVKIAYNRGLESLANAIQDSKV